MPEPKAKYPKDSTFAKRIGDNRQKRIVGRYIAQKFLSDGVTAFITDGSSTLYVGLALYAEAVKQPGFMATIYTNNLALAHEYPLWDKPPKREIPSVHVSMSSGNVISDLTMVGGIDAQAYSKIRAEASDCIIISVRNLFGDRGPTGREDESLKIKRSALKGAKDKKVIFVADYTKLLESYNRRVMPLIYDSSKDWEEMMRTDSTYLVSTRIPDSTVRELGREITPTEKKRYQRNRDLIYSKMNKDKYGRDMPDDKKRFIEVDRTLLRRTTV